MGEIPPRKPPLNCTPSSTSAAASPVHPHFRRQNARRHRPRPTPAGTRGRLRHGSRLRRLRPSSPLHDAASFFVTRAKRNLDVRRRDSRPVDKTTGLRSDPTVVLAGSTRARLHPTAPPHQLLRSQTGKLVFLTNHFDLPAVTIAHLYKCRWQVELFFKWIKQHLHIKRSTAPPRTP